MRSIIVVLALLFIHSGMVFAAGKPNILVVLTDDQGCGDLSAAGTKDIRTPHMV